MRQTLAVIGASYLQLPLVLKAKEMGLRVVCFAWEEGAVCKEVADVFYPISIVDKVAILEVCRSEKVDGVISIASDVAMPTVAYVASKMGLSGNSIATVEKSTNKYLMRLAFRDANVSCPKFVVIEDAFKIDEVVKDLDFPLVVKPVDRSGSMGVVRVEDKESLKVAVTQAIDVSFCKKAIVEECIQNMREVSVEGISWKGNYHLLQVTDKVTTGAPRYVELAHHQPAILSEKMRLKIAHLASMGVAALGIEHGATHTEIMIDEEDNLYVTEIGSRMGGDFIGSDLVFLSTGYDFIKGVIETALGQFTPPVLDKKGCSGVWFYSLHTPKALDYICGKESSSLVVRSELQSQNLTALSRSADRSGYFIYKGIERLDIPCHL